MWIGRFLLFYLIFISFYHLFSTFLVWKLGLNKFFVSLSKDILWFSFVLILFLLNWKNFLNFLKKYRFLIFLLVLYILVWIVVSFYRWGSFKQMLIGFKYDILPFVIFITSLFVWYLLNIRREKLKVVFNILVYFGIFLVLNFIIWILKIVFPGIFYSLWYWKIRNFLPNLPPPVYYTSGAWGLPRLSWLFWGPNEYGFFLLFFLSIFYYFAIKLDTFLKVLRRRFSDIARWYFSKLYFWDLINGFFTLSRAYLLWVIIESIIAFRKKLVDKLIWTTIWFIILFIGLFVLNKARPLSTFDHFALTKLGILYVKDNPLWYGLWTAWPSAFYTANTNNLREIKKKVPENTYLQIAIDMGVIGVILFVVILFYIIKLWLVPKNSLENNLKRYSIYGFIWLLVAGFFLHIFGDSMVVYFIFIWLWLILW